VFDIGEWHRVDVEDDFASGNLLEQALIGVRGIRSARHELVEDTLIAPGGDDALRRP
jgi:hypothetical protein